MCSLSFRLSGWSFRQPSRWRFWQRHLRGRNPQAYSGCNRNLADATANVAAMQARVKSLGAMAGTETCTATRLYFLELVKARAVTALCKNGAERDRDLGRFDADVDHTNEAIAARCS